MQKEAGNGELIPEHISKQLNFDSTTNVNILEIERADGSNMWCAHSKPAWYIDKGNEFKVIDCMVFANTKESAENDIKEEAQNYYPTTMERELK